MRNVRRALQFALLARKSAKKRHNTKRLKEEMQDVAQRVTAQKSYSKSLLQAQTTSLRALKDDWERGALAPRREGGFEMRTYGFVGMELTMEPKALKQAIDFAKQQYQRGVLRNLFAIGDRVVIIRGPHRGRIRTIKTMLYESYAAVLAFYGNLAYLPDEGMARRQGWPENEIGEPQAHQFAVPWENLRLVMRIGDEDVIVDRMEIHSSTWDEVKNAEIPAIRYIPSTNISIPTPEPELEEKTKPQFGEEGSLQYVVHDNSFTPTLSEAPVKESVLDELRGRYGRFRVRYPQAILKKAIKQNEREQIMKDASKLMRTPIQEYAEKERRLAEARMPKEIDEASLARIGEAMLQNMKHGSKPQELPIR